MCHRAGRPLRNRPAAGRAWQVWVPGVAERPVLLGAVVAEVASGAAEVGGSVVAAVVDDALTSR